MIANKSAKQVMDEATDSASEHLEGVQNAAEVADQFNAQVDKASELDSVKYKKKL